MKKIIKKFINKNIYTDHAYQYLSTIFYFYKIKKYPFGKKLNSNRETYLALFKNTKEKNYNEVLSYEKKKDFIINNEWLANLALITQVTIKKSSLCFAHGRVIYTCLSDYIKKINKKINIIETGTSKGFSSLCMAKALKDQGRIGTIHTIDILPKDKKIFWNSISDFEGKKNRYELLEKWSDLVDKYIFYYEGFSKKILNKKIKLERVHFAFLDGSHTYQDVGYEFKFVAKRQIKNDIIIVDDYNIQYPGLIKAVDKYAKLYNYSLEFINSSKNRTYVICSKI